VWREAVQKLDPIWIRPNYYYLGYRLGITAKHRRGAAGIGLGTTTDIYRCSVSAAVGYGPGTTS
jgi:hypothetical protein